MPEAKVLPAPSSTTMLPISIVDCSDYYLKMTTNDEVNFRMFEAFSSPFVVPSLMTHDVVVVSFSIA